MAKDPAVLFYYQDFLVGIEFMDDDHIGKYIRILCHQADKGHLAEKQVQSICKASAIPDDIMEKLKIDDKGKYFNQRMHDECDKRRKFTESRRNNASKSKSICKASAKLMEDVNENKDINEKEIKKEYIDLSLVWIKRAKDDTRFNAVKKDEVKFRNDLYKLNKTYKLSFEIITNITNYLLLKETFWYNNVGSPGKLYSKTKDKQFYIYQKVIDNMYSDGYMKKIKPKTEPVKGYKWYENKMNIPCNECGTMKKDCYITLDGNIDTESCRTICQVCKK